jgi:3-oxoacyl-(acyl-carrier-protein) synthase
MRELSNVVSTGMGAITSRGDVTLRGASTLSLHGEARSQIENFALETYLASPKTYLDRCSALALAGSALALRDAGIEGAVSEENFGITLGTHLGCIETMKNFWDKTAEKGVRLANPLLFSHSYFNSPISLCAIEFGLKGYHATFCAREYSGAQAVRAAFDAIRLGHADAMLCGGVEALTPTRELCENGKAIGEASTFFVLENSEHASSRGVVSALPVDESWFKNLASQVEEIHTRFGNCGGATSTLALALHALSFDHS